MPDPTAPQPPGEAQGIDCAQARRLVRVLETESLPHAIARALQRHRRECDECDGFYRSSLEGAAELQQFERRRTLRAPATPFWVPLLQRRRLLALRFLLVCLLVFLASRAFGGFREDPTLAVERLAGRAWVGGEELLDGVERAWRSDLLETDAQGRLQLTTGRIRVELHPDSQLLVESALAQRVRLLAGEMEVSGDLDVQTSAGVVRGSGGAFVLGCEGGQLAIECRTGRVEWISARGVVQLGPGDRSAPGPP